MKTWHVSWWIRSGGSDGSATQRMFSVRAATDVDAVKAVVASRIKLPYGLSWTFAVVEVEYVDASGGIEPTGDVVQIGGEGA